MRILKIQQDVELWLHIFASKGQKYHRAWYLSVQTFTNSAIQVNNYWNYWQSMEEGEPWRSAAWWPWGREHLLEMLKKSTHIRHKMVELLLRHCTRENYMHQTTFFLSTVNRPVSLGNIRSCLTIPEGYSTVCAKPSGSPFIVKATPNLINTAAANQSTTCVRFRKITAPKFLALNYSVFLYQRQSILQQSGQRHSMIQAGKWILKTN
jgi:hypothetical protein